MSGAARRDRRALPFDLWVITDPTSPRGLAPYLEALEAGVPGWALAIRDHEASDRELGRTVERLASHGAEVPRVIAAASFERVHLAARLGVGVQLAERAPSVEVARASVGDRALIAASVHDAEGLARRVGEGVDLVLLAPFGAVTGKGAPLSDAAVEAITEASDAPVFALGAIRAPEDVARALALGCAGVAVRSWLATSADGARAVAQLRGWIDGSRQERDSALGSR